MGGKTYDRKPNSSIDGVLTRSDLRDEDSVGLDYGVRDPFMRTSS